MNKSEVKGLKWNLNKLRGSVLHFTHSLKKKSKMAARAKMFAAYKSSIHNSTKMNFLFDIFCLGWVHACRFSLPQAFSWIWVHVTSLLSIQLHWERLWRIWGYPCFFPERCYVHNIFTTFSQQITGG